jgi:beta-glucosidase
MQKLVSERLPEITDATSNLLVGSSDFIGINHYTSLYARNDRTRIHKLIMQDAISDAAVITTGKLLLMQILKPFFLLI